MRIIIILAAIVLLSNSSSLQQVQQVQQVQTLAGPENQGVIECIVFYSKDIIDVKSTCGAYVSDNAECYKEYRAVELCLINNNCQYPKEAPSISTECWNCWKDLPLSSAKFTDFQEKIARCSQTFIRIALLAIACLFLLA